MDFTLHLDIASEVTNAPDTVQQILAQNSMALGDQKNVKANTKIFLNWLLRDFYLKLYETKIGFTKEMEFWPKQKHADILLNKIELISPGLTQKWDAKEKEYVPLPIKNAVARRFHYDTDRRKMLFGILPKGMCTDKIES